MAEDRHLVDTVVTEDKGASDDGFPQLAPIPSIQKMSGGESRSSIYRALQRGELLAVKRGRRTLIDVDSARRRIRNLPKANFRSPQSTTELVDMDPQAREAFE
jgi:hypothetical protein